MAGLTDKGIREFDRLQAAAEPAIADLVEPGTVELSGNVARHAWEAWASGDQAGLVPIHDRVCSVLKRSGGLQKPDHLDLFTHISEVEQHAFIVGFEAARRLMNGSR